MIRRVGGFAAALGIALFVTLWLPVRAYAQEVNLARLDEEAANHVYVRTGAEWALVGSVGYARTVAAGQHRLVLVGEVTAPWATMDTSDYQVRVGALVPIFGWGGWRLAGSFEPTVRGTKNDLGRMTSIGANAGVTGGYYAHRWFVAGELGFDYTLATGIKNSALYRDAVYPDARDGWYVNPGGNYRLGGQAGASFGSYDLAVRGGILREMMGEPPMFPFYATLALSTSW
jgi:hypothetical protein